MTRGKLILDTDPGTDDILALLLALYSDELELELVSLTFGNTVIANCLLNAVTCFHVIEQDTIWRQSCGLERRKPAWKPVLAVGAGAPLLNQTQLFDEFYGKDGLGDSSTRTPHFLPKKPYLHMSPTAPAEAGAGIEYTGDGPSAYRPSSQPAHLEILRVLRENPPNTVVICAIGPLTNLALAAQEDAETLVRAREVVVMGCTIGLPGNVTPVAEFNTFSDPIAAAVLYSLSSPNPSSTLPPNVQLAAPSRPLRITVVPLDLTSHYRLTREASDKALGSMASKGSPLAGWVTSFLGSSFVQARHQYTQAKAASSFAFSMHDPVATWYALNLDSPAWTVKQDVDLRVETGGQWTRGMTIVDRRARAMLETAQVDVSDTNCWLIPGRGNRLRIVEDNSEFANKSEEFCTMFLARVFGA